MSRRELKLESPSQGVVAADPPSTPESQGSLRRYLPTPFRAWMAFNVWVELSTIYALATRKSNVVELSPWFDRRSYYTKNTAMGYMYMAVLVALVCTRAFLLYRPELAMLVLYGAAVHWVEVAFFGVLISAKNDWGFDEVKGKNPGTEIYVLIGFILFNAMLLTFRYFSIASSLQRERVENDELRRQQLAEIRRKRAEYKQRKLAEKNQ